MATLNNSDINLLVGLDFSRALATDVPRAAAQMEKLFNSAATFKKLSGPLGNISTSASEFAKSLEAANARVIAFGASVGVVYNIQKAFEKLVESTISVEKALTDIQVISNQSSKEIAKFGAELFRIGNQTGQTFENVSQAALEFSRQGLTVSETLKRTKDALILTRISGLDATKAVETLTAAVNSFGNGLLTTTQLVNKFVAVDTNFAVSSRDLAEAISRVGSTAEDSKVSLDELLGVVTAVQQSTARGGAVIGNAFKTIFTRLQRADTIEQLRELGVEIDNTQTGIQKLKAISETVKNADVTTAARIKELAAGVFQVNILSAALDDLSKSYGTYTAAQKTSENATDQAIQNNEKLNKSLASLLTRTQNNITQTFANIGNQSISSPFRKILEFLNEGLEETNQATGENIGKGLLNGLSKFIEGPGIAIAGNIALRLFGAFYSFSKDAFKQLTSLGEASKQRAAAEQAISNILQNQPQLLQAILSGERGVIGAQNEILLQLKQRLVLQEKIAAFARASAPLVGAAGMAINPDTRNIIRSKTASGGYVPKKDRIAESLGAMAGGYVPGNIKTMNINGLGKVVYNDAEKVQNFPGMSQPAIMPPQNSKAGKKYLQEFKGKHGFNPYVPNFANFQEQILHNIGGKKLIKFGNIDVGSITLGNLEDEMASINYIRTMEKGKGLSSILYEHGLGWLYKQGYKGVTGELIRQNLKPLSKSPFDRFRASFPQTSRGKFGARNEIIYDEMIYDLLGGQAFKGDLQRKAPFLLKESGDPIFNTYFRNKGFVPNFLPIGMLKAYREVLGKIKNKNVNFFGQEEASKIWGPLKSAGGFYNPKDQSINISQDLKKSNWDLGFVAAHEGVHNIVDLLSKPEYKSKLKSPALRRGNIKNKLIDSGFNIYTKILAGESDPTYTFKRLNSSPDLYPNPASSFMEESLADNSLAIIKDRRTLGFSDKTSYNFRKLFERLNKAGRNLSSGFIPNFSAISDAISRESKSVPKSLIRIGQSSRLKSQGNPYGLGVYNLRDEPSGLNQGINRAYSEGLNPKSYGIPNFLPPSKFIKGEYSVEGGSLIPASIYKKLQSDIRNTFRGLFSEFEKGTISAREMTRQLESVQKQFNLTDDALLKIKSGFSKFKKELLIDADFKSALISGQSSVFGDVRSRNAIQRQESLVKSIAGQNVSVALSSLKNTSIASGFDFSSFRDFGQSKIRQSQINDFINAQNETRGKFYNVGKIAFDKAAQEYLSSKFTPGTSYEDLMGAGTNKEKLKYAQRIQEIQQKVSTTRSFDIFGLAGQGKLFKELESIRKNYSDLIGKEDIAQLKEVRSGKLQNVALGASFLIPMISETVKASLGDSESGRKTGAVVSSVGSVASLAATGAALGGGLPGLGIGAGVGLLLEVPKLFDELSSSLPELEKQFEKLQERTNQNSQSISSYISVSEKLADIYSGKITGATQGQIKLLQQQQRESYFGIRSKYKGDLLSAIESGDFRRSREIEAKSMLDDNQSQILNRTLADLEKRKPGFWKRLTINQDSRTVSDFQRPLGFYEGLAIDNSIISDLSRKSFEKDYLSERARGRDIGKAGLSKIFTLRGKDQKNLLDIFNENPESLSKLLGLPTREEKEKFIKSLAAKNDISGIGDIFEGINRSLSGSKFATEGYGVNFEKYLKSLQDLAVSGQKINIDEIQTKLNISSVNFSKLISEIQKYTTKITDSIDLDILKKEGALEVSQIQRQYSDRIKSINAGEYQSSDIDFASTIQRNIESKTIGLERIVADENKKNIKVIQSSYVDALKGIRESIFSDRENEINAPEKFAKAKTELEKFYKTIGFSFDNGIPKPPSDVSFFKKDLSGVIPALSGEMNTILKRYGFPTLKDGEGFDKSQRDIVLKVLQSKLEELSDIENERISREQDLIQKYKNSTAAINEEFEARKKLIGAENANLQIRLRLNGEAERVTQSVVARDELNRLKFSNQTENLGFGLNSFQRQRFNFQRSFQNIDLESEGEFNIGKAKILESLKNSKLGLSFQNIQDKQDLEKIIKDTSADPDLLAEAQKTLIQIENLEKRISQSRGEKIEKQKELNSQLEIELKRRMAFSDAVAEDNLLAIRDRITDNPNYTLSRKDVFSTIRNELSYNNATLQRDAILGVSEVTQTMKQSFSEATASIIKDGKDVGQAFKDVLLSVLNKITDRVSQMSTDLFFNGLTSLGKSVIGKNSGGIIRQYSTGGQVTGGSGVKDDVPALLTDGEYVINKRAVQKIGLKNLEKLNYGNEKEAILNLRNEFAYNDPKRPTKGYFNTDSNLSGFGLSDTEISRVNQLKFEREGQFYDYLAEKRDYDLNKSNAMAQFKAQKRNRLYGAYLNAFIGVAGAGLSSYAGSFTNSSGVSRSYLANARNAGVTINSSGIPNMNTGGIIQKFANGGHVFGGNTPTDNIPALLTGGEYVIKRDKVNKIGISTLDSLNYGNAKRFADGGLVGKQDAGISSFNSDIFNTLVLSINKLNDTLSSKKDNPTSSQNGNTNNYISVSINIDSKGNVNSNNNSRTEGGNQNKNTNENNDRQNSEKLGRQLEAKMKAVVLDELRQGGSIYTFVNSKV